MKYFVLMYPNGKFVAIDRDCGYPYETDRLDIAKIWPECFEDEMHKCINMFSHLKWDAKSILVSDKY